jgi:hypothetical protein
VLKQARIGTIATFCNGLVVGVAGIVFLGGGRDQTTAPAARAADQPGTAQIGRYQVFKVDIQNDKAGLLDTATGKVWSLRAAGNSKWTWFLLTDGPK